MVLISTLYLRPRINPLAARLRHYLLRGSQFQKDWSRVGHLGRNRSVQAGLWFYIRIVRVVWQYAAYAADRSHHRRCGTGHYVGDAEVDGGCDRGVQGVYCAHSAADGRGQDVERYSGCTEGSISACYAAS